MLINKFISNNKKTSKNILFVRQEIYFPLVGMAILGNVLIIINYFVGLKNPLTLLIVILLLLPNFIGLSI